MTGCDKVGRTPSYTGLFNYPYTSLFIHPTFCSPVLPLLRSTPYWIVHPSYLLLPRLRSTPYSIVQPSHLIVPYHIYHVPLQPLSYTGLFSHPTLSYPIIHPTRSYTGLFIHYNLCQPCPTMPSR